MSRLRSYPKYKDSGVEWLGVLPEHWAVGRLKNIVDPYRPITYGIVQAGENLPYGVPYIRPADMSDEDGVKDFGSILKTSPEIAASYERSKVKEGDLICSIGPSFGKVMVVPSSLTGANLTQGTARIAVGSHGHAGYVFWLLRSSGSFQQWESTVGGATFRALNLGPLSETTIPIPRQLEQGKIADFLDQETSKIDRLIAEQQCLIELLKEKQQAVISHAVTKGLDPTVPMKDSGVEWLGQVPAHWGLKKAGFIGQLFGSESVPEDRVVDAGNIPFLKVSSLSSESLEVASCEFFLDSSLEDRYAAMDSFIAFPKRGAAIFLNKVNVVGFRSLLDPNLMGWKLVDGNNLRYFAHVLKCRKLEELADVSTVPQINNKHIAPEIFPCPTPKEQNEIASLLDTKLDMFAEMVREAQLSIQLLIERRAAVISSAVTGKIDLRAWQPLSTTTTSEAAHG